MKTIPAFLESISIREWNGHGEAGSSEDPVSFAESVTADLSVAVPDFTATQRAKVLTPLLTAAQNAKALKWNQSNHPSKSGVEGAELARELRRYVDFSAVRSAISAFNLANPSQPIVFGLPPFDAVCTEALHQFQLKCFVDPGQADGKAGESTLDSLGLIARTGMNSVDNANAAAKKRLKDVASDISTSTGGEFTATHWFKFMMNPSFLGRRFTNGVHAVLIRKLRIAERHLLSNQAFTGMTPVELGQALGMEEDHKGARPAADSANMHTFGLAADLNFLGNPWVAGQHEAPISNQRTTQAVNRAALLIRGETVNFTPRFLHGLRLQSTGDIFDTLQELHEALKSYLRLNGDNAAIETTLRARQADNTAGVFRNQETLAAATTRWRGLIRSDIQKLTANDNFVNRDPRDGFLELNRNLVIALRDTACLAWGAVDFGAAESGDIMHFDCRIDGVGRVAITPGSFKPVDGHVCIPATTSATQSEGEWAENSRSLRSLEAAVPSLGSVNGRRLLPTVDWITPKSGNGGIESINLTLKISGSPVPGDSIYKSLKRENTIDCLYYEQAVQSPNNVATGQASGKREHLPLVIGKRIDRSSPLLSKALVENQGVEATFKFYRQSQAGTGAIEHFYTVELKQARVISVRQLTAPASVKGIPGPLLEEVGLTFQNITWTWTQGGISQEDTWSAK